MAVQTKYTQEQIDQAPVSTRGLVRNSPEWKIAIAARRLRVLHKHRKTVVTWLGGKCERCGYDKDDRALCYHHRKPLRTPVKNRRTVDIPFRNQSITPEKLAKWRREGHLLCQNCHALVHHYNEEPYVESDIPRTTVEGRLPQGDSRVEEGRDGLHEVVAGAEAHV